MRPVEYGPVEPAMEREKLARRLNGFLIFVMGAAFAWALAELFRGVFSLGLDATDADTWNRSGMRLHMDYGTGCMYLSTASGSLTPRLNSAGVPMCSGAPE